MEKTLKEQIIILRAKGKSYREIEKELGCARSTVSYHLGINEKDNTLRRRTKRHKILIIQLKNQLGGKCNRCGYDKCFEALEFHHKNPSEKDGLVNNLLRNSSYAKAEAEAKKCVLLCANCHREEHYPNDNP